jgi:hypothetical protein
VLGVPAEIVIEAAVPAEAWPEPLPPVVHAAIATPMTETAITSARMTTARVFLLPVLSVRISFSPFIKGSRPGTPAYREAS